MKNTSFTILAISVAIILFAITKPTTGNPISTTDNSKNFVLMELFTSQGCSSCPRADELLGQYATMNDSRIIPIAFHVDYWNNLGWKDSFSNAKFSQRQSYYDFDFLHASVYTPQLIINGEYEMVGSNKDKIKATVDKVLNETAAAIINIKNKIIADGQFQLEYTISGTYKHSILNVVLVQSKTVTKIKAGENGGITLINYNVVRNYVHSPAKNSGYSFSKLPAGVDLKDLSVVAFTQDTTTGKITGAIKENL